MANRGRGEEKRIAAVENLFGQDMLETEKIKQKVRETNQYKQIKLALSGERLLVTCGGGKIDMLEFLDRKGFLPRH